MLDKNGVLILSVPQHMFLWSKLDEIVKHKRRYSRVELLGKLREQGFVVNRVTSFVFFLFPLMLVSRLIDRSSSKPEAEDSDLEKRVQFHGFVNKVFDAFMRIDECLIKIGISLPFGGTLVVVARKSQ